MSLILPIDRVVTVSINPVDVAGNAAPVDGVPQWTSANTAYVTVTPAADGLSAELKPVGLLGNVQVSVTADALLGPETRTLTGLLDVQIVGGEAVALSIAPGALRLTPKSGGVTMDGGGNWNG